MKNQILDPMTCELQVGDVVQVISSEDKHIAEIIKIDGESCPFQIQTKTGWIMWRKRSELRLISRIHQPEKTMKKTSEKIAAFAANVASLTEALDEAADMVECLEAQIEGAEALREINKKLGERVDELEAKNQKQSEYLAECHRVLAFNRERNQIHGYVRLLLYASEVAGKLQVSEAVVWDMFFSVCKRAVFTIPEAPEPVEPPVMDDFKECRGGFDCNGVQVNCMKLDEGDKCVTLVEKLEIKKGQIVEVYDAYPESDRYYCIINGIQSLYKSKELRKISIKS